MDITQNSQVSMNNIFKVHILNHNGDIDRVFVFCAGLCSTNELSNIFSEMEQIHLKENNVDIIFSNRLIHRDDTIHEIKQKIVLELIEYETKHNSSKYYLSLDELYLFSTSPKDVDMVKFYQDATNNEQIPLTKERFFQYITNISADPYALETNFDKTLDKDIFTYDDWSSVVKSGIHNIFTPIGMEFKESYDFRLSSNPYHNQLWTQPFRYEMTSSNPLLTFDKSVLLDYTDSTNIMVCLAMNVYKHAESINISSEYFCDLYFPFLQKRGLNSLNLLNNSILELSEETNVLLQSNILKRNNVVLDTYRQINWTKQSNSELPYIEKGIKKFSLTIRASDYSHALPMDLLFRNIHSSQNIPFIKYNPGNRRENMYRLYSNEISSDGRKIPILDEALIMRLSRETGKGKQISIYITGKYPIFVNVNSNSEIELLGSLNISIGAEELDEILKKTITPVIDNMNDILNSSGYSIRKFEGINGYHIYKSMYTYQAVLPIDVQINLDKQLHYITPIFDVLDTDITKVAKMQFKRVRNYREMDAKFAIIREIYERSDNADDVIQGLIDNYDMTEESAISLYGEFRSQFQVLNRQIVDNPGFPTELRMRPMKNELIIEVKSISSIKYLEILHVYIDTILRLSQKPKSITIPTTMLNKFKTKPKIVEENVSDIVNNVETIVAPTTVLNDEIYKPMMFHNEEKNKDVQDIIPPSGLDFEEDYDYEYESGEDKYVYDDDDDDDLYGGEGDNKSDGFNANIDGMPIKNPSPFFKRMLERDPVLYITEESSKFPLYSKACPSGDKRQPVILTDAEKKRIDYTNPGSYGKALLHGSNSENKHWYICPRYWCLKTNTSISEEDVKAGKCGAIIPRGSDRVPPGAYVYEFNNPKVHMKDGKYVQHVPGFLKKEKHPNGLCIPCCFSKEWNSADQKGRRDKCDYQDPDDMNTENNVNVGKKNKKKSDLSQKMLSYIIGSVSYPLPVKRWGFLPESLQLFLKTDNSLVMDPQNPAVIIPGASCILRYGVEKSDNQSFLSCFAYYYAYKHNLSAVPTLSEMRTIFVDSINLDLFIQYHNGNLVSIFRPKLVTRWDIELEKYSTSEFYKTIDMDDEIQVDHLEDTIASYEHFLLFIQDDKSLIDHTYLWDFFSNRNPKLLLDGMNLIILQISDNDITEKVQMICPSNAYSHVEYNPRKETVILVKQDNYYEPIHLYEQNDTIIVAKTDELVYSLKSGEQVKDKHVIDSNRNVKYTLKSGETKKSEIVFKPTFLEHSAINEIRDMLKLIQSTTKKYCAPLPSMPRKYSFKRNIQAIEIIRILKIADYMVEYQILNYRNKTVGILTKKDDNGNPLIYIPCFPSAIIPDMKTKYMDDDLLWTDYRQTRDLLNEVSVDTKGGIFSKPIIKIVEDGLVVGFLTETNQFVQINPPTQPLDNDGINTVEHSTDAYSKSDKELTTWKHESKTRRRVIRNINLETQFYNIFRSLVRIHLNDYDNRKLRQDILNKIDDSSYSYNKKLKYIEKQIFLLLREHVRFDEIDADKLRSLETVVMCKDCESNKSSKFCITTEDGNCRTIFPKSHLLSGAENKRIYFGRMADELIRYSRIRIFMFQPKTYMNITNTDLQINNDELFLLESRLTREYFRNMVAYNTNKYVNNIEYDNAQPEITQTYVNNVSLDEQSIMTQNVEKTKKDQFDDYILDCIQQTKMKVIGDTKLGTWRSIFPVEAKEIVFKHTGECSFIPIIYIFQEVYNSKLSVKNIKTSLWKEYSRLIEESTNVNKIYSILRNQGKRSLIDRVKTGKITFEMVLFSEEYYITDLDLWIFCKIAKLPVILFSSTTLKHLSLSINWLKLGGKGEANEKYYFIRTPLDVRLNKPPAYHIIQPSYSLSELRSSMFLEAERGDSLYKPNMQSIEMYIEKTTFISKTMKI